MEELEKIEISLCGHKEYTFKTFEDKSILNQEAEQSLFNCSTFKCCKVEESDFSKCDFEGSIFNDTDFEDTCISSCDIKSSYFKNCTFKGCNFSLGAIADSDFINCVFSNCCFDDAILKDNRFNTCTFSQGTYIMATITLSIFYKCSFNDIFLGNCSFYDHIMNKCQYDNVSINIDSIGRISGYSLDDLRNFKYVFLGEEYGYAPEIFFSHLQEIYNKKSWKLPELLYRFNIGEISPYAFIVGTFNALIYYIKENIIVKRDDLSFFVNIIAKMKEDNQLPLFALYEGFTSLLDCVDLLEDGQHYNKAGLFREFLNNTFFIINESMAEFANQFPQEVEMGALNEEILMRIHYDSNMEINFAQYINSFLKYEGYDTRYFCQLKAIQSGSIIEIIAGSILCVYALQILLYGVNGILVQLTDMVTKIRVLKSKKDQKDYLSTSILGKQHFPEMISKVFELFKMKEFKDNISSLASVLNGKSIIDVSTVTNKEP